MPGSDHCWSHDASTAEERRRRASKGGKRGGRGRPVSELNALRTENGTLRQQMLDGELEPRVLSVAIQSINVEARLIEAMLKAKEQEELEQRMTDLEEALNSKRSSAGSTGRRGF